MSMRVDPPFVGEGRQKVVEGLANLLLDAQLKEQARWVSIEAPSGWGKTRVAHAFYERLASRQEKRYWPATILEATDATFLDVASRRKRVFPDPARFDRQAGSLPEFFWWGIACDLRHGVPTQALKQDLRQLEAHSIFLEAAWSAATSFSHKAGLTPQHARVVAAKLAEEAASEGLEKLTEELLKASLPGMGLAISLAKFGFGKARTALRHRELIGQAGALTEQGSLDIVEEVAATLRRLARPRLPVIVFIEDLHRDDGLVTRLLENLIRADAPILILTTTWPGEIERSAALTAVANDPSALDRIYRLRHDRAVPDAFPSGASMDALPPEALKELIRSYYPSTSQRVLNGLAGRYNNPLPIELICTHPRHVRNARQGELELTDAEIARLPWAVDQLYRQLWSELPYPAQCVLALSTLAIPERGAAWHRELVAGAVASVSAYIGDSEEGHADASVPHGWVREVEDWLRQFNEPDQLYIARSQIEDEVLFGQEVVESFLDAVVHDLEERGFESVATASEEMQHRAWLALALRTRDRISDDLALDAVRILLEALSDSPLELRTSLSLGEVFQQLKIPPDDPRGFEVGHHLARALLNAGRSDESVAAFEALLVGERRVFGDGSSDVLATRSNLLLAKAEAGHLAEAIEDCSKLLSDMEASSDVDAADVLLVLGNLAAMLVRSGSHAESIALAESVLAAQRRSLGEDHPDVLRSRHNLATAMGEAGQTSEAISALDALLTDRRRLLGEDHPDVLQTQNSLAEMLGRMGRYVDARETFESVLAGRRRVLGDDHPDTLKTRFDLASMLAQADRAGDAIVAYELLLPDQRRVLGAGHGDFLAARHNLALLLAEAGRSTEAIEAFEQSLADEGRALGEDHPHVLRTRHYLAFWMGESGRDADAIAAFDSLLLDQGRVLGDTHPLTLQTRYSRAVQLAKVGRLGDAVSAIEALIPDQQHVYGEDHPEVLKAQHDIALMLADAGQIEKAMSAFERSIAARERVMGSNHSSVLDAQHDCATVLIEHEKYEVALDLLEQLRAKQELVFGKHHLDSLRTRSNISFVLGKLGAMAPAILTSETLLIDLESILGDDHPEFLATQHHLASLVEEFLIELGAKHRDLGGSHPEVLHMLQQLSTFQSMQGEWPHEA